MLTPNIQMYREKTGFLSHEGSSTPFTRPQARDRRRVGKERYSATCTRRRELQRFCPGFNLSRYRSEPANTGSYLAFSISLAVAATYTVKQEALNRTSGWPVLASFLLRYRLVRWRSKEKINENRTTADGSSASLYKMSLFIRFFTKP